MRSPPLVPSLVVCVCAFVSSGCIRSVLTRGQIAATRTASSALDTIGDYELARSATQSALVEFEGMHQLAPDDTDALFLLTKGWVGYGFGFVEDEMEAAEDRGDEDLAQYERQRARMAFDRAVFYGLELLGHRDAAFAQARKSHQALSRWLKDRFKGRDDAENLFWTGYGWMARADLMKGDDTEGPAFVADLYIGVDMVQRAMDIDPSLEHSGALVALAAYHARSGMAELDQSKQLFDAAIAASRGTDLMIQFDYATKYACIKGDAALYEGLLGQVLAAGDPDPSQRLENAMAKRWAKRWLAPARAKEMCGIDLGRSR